MCDIVQSTCETGFLSILVHVLSSANIALVYYWSDREAKKNANALCTSLERTFAFAAKAGITISKISSDNALNVKNWARLHFVHYMAQLKRLFAA